MCKHILFSLPYFQGKERPISADSFNFLSPSLKIHLHPDWAKDRNLFFFSFIFTLKYV
jgi:hypothetical protein